MYHFGCVCINFFRALKSRFRITKLNVYPHLKTLSNKKIILFLLISETPEKQEFRLKCLIENGICKLFILAVCPSFH